MTLTAWSTDATLQLFLTVLIVTKSFINALQISNEILSYCKQSIKLCINIDKVTNKLQIM